MKQHLTLLTKKNDNFLDTLDAPNVSLFSDTNNLEYTETKEEVEVTLTINSFLCGSFCAPFDIKLPDGVTASYCHSVVNGRTTFRKYETTDNILPAYTPALLESDKTLSQTYKGYLTIKNDYVKFNQWTYGSLRRFNRIGVLGDSPVYVLSANDNNEIGFYRYTGEFVPANKIFLTY